MSKSALADPPLVQVAQRAVRQLLQSGALIAGDSIDVSDLASRLRLDRRSLAIGISNLEADGLVVRTGEGKFTVRAISNEEISEILTLRCGIESRVAERLAAIATEIDLADLRDLVEEQRRAAQVDDKVLFMDHAAEFHCVLAERAKFSHAAEILRNWQDLQRVIGVNALHDRNAMLRVVREHSELLDMIETHQPDEARELLTRHLEATAGRLSVEIHVE